MKAVTASNAALKREVARLTEANAVIETALDTMRGERNQLRLDLGKWRQEHDHLAKSAAVPVAAESPRSWSSLIASAIGGFILGALAALLSVG